MVEPNPSRRLSAAPFVDKVLDPADDVAAAVQLAGGADVIFTATSAPESHPLAVQCVAPRGSINLFGGLPKDGAPVALDTNLIHYREALVTGSHGSTPASIPRPSPPPAAPPATKNIAASPHRAISSMTRRC